METSNLFVNKDGLLCIVHKGKACEIEGANAEGAWIIITSR